MLSPANILSLHEVKTVVSHLKGFDTDQALLHLAIFRLSACCGLRCKEMAGLDLFDLVKNGDYPYLHLRKDIVKGEQGKRKARRVPLYWDHNTYLDLCEWYDYRLGWTLGQNGPFLAALRADHRGKRLAKGGIAKHWTRILSAALGPERARAISLHHGRHSYASLCLAAGISLVEVRDALGHSSINTTSIYLHAAGTDVRNVFSG
jgi:integrase/recombinase XerD